MIPPEFLSSPQIQALRSQVEELQGYKDDMDSFNTQVDLRLTILKGGPAVSSSPAKQASPPSSSSSGAAPQSLGSTPATTSGSSSSTPSTLPSNSEAPTTATLLTSGATSAEQTKIDGIVASML
jgi:hypothetical protein